MAQSRRFWPARPSRRGPERDDPALLDRSQRLELYRVAVDEYRFQVQLNWDRAKYLLAFNTAVLGAGTGLIKIGGNSARGLIAGIFIVGSIAAIVSICAIYLQHGYYRATRNAMTTQAEQLNLGAAAVETTPGARGARLTIISKLGRVQNILYVLLVVIAGINGYGVYYAFNK